MNLPVLTLLARVFLYSVIVYVFVCALLLL